MSMAADVGDLIRGVEQIRVQYLALAKEHDVKVILD